MAASTTQYWIAPNKFWENSVENWSATPGGTGNTWGSGNAIFQLTDSDGSFEVQGGITLTGMTVESTVPGTVFSLWLQSAGLGELRVSGAVTFSTPGVSTILKLPITGTGSVTYSGELFIVQDINTYAGGTTVSAGTSLEAWADGVLPNGGDLTIEATGKVSLKEATTGSTVGGLSGGGALELGSNTLTVGAGQQAGDSSAFSGSFVQSGNGALVKLGAGRLILDGDNGPQNWVGNVTVSDGELILRNTKVLGIGTPMTVKETGTLTIENIEMGGMQITAEAGTVVLENARAVGGLEFAGAPYVQLQNDAELLIVTDPFQPSAQETMLKLLSVKGSADTQVTVTSRQYTSIDIGSIDTRGDVSLDKTELNFTPDFDPVETPLMLIPSVIDGTVSGNGAIRITGSLDPAPGLAAKLTLSGNNTFEGGVTLAGAKLTLGQATSAGSGVLSFAADTKNWLEVQGNGLSAELAGVDDDDTIDLQTLNFANTTITKTLSVDGKTLTVSDGQESIVLQFTDALDEKNAFSFTGDTDNSVLLRITEPDLLAPTATLGTSVLERGDWASVSSTEAGTVYLVKADKLQQVSDAASFDALVTDKFAAKASFLFGEAQVFTTGLPLGEYVAFAVDAAGNVSVASTQKLKLLALPEITVPGVALSFTENGPNLLVAPTLTLTDDDGSVPSGVDVYLYNQPPSRMGNLDNGPSVSILVSYGPPPDTESLVFTANALLFGGIHGSYDPIDGVLSLTDSNAGQPGAASMSQWQAALQSIAYKNVAETAVGTRRVEFVVHDGELQDSRDASLRINLIDVPDAPEIEGVSTGVKIVQVGEAAAWGNTVEISDVDSVNLMITVTATNGEIHGLNIVQRMMPEVQITNIEPGTFTLYGSAELLTEWLQTATFTLGAAGQGSVTIKVTDDTDLTTTKTLLFASQAVTPTTPPVVTPGQVDGVPVQVGTAPDGTQVITVPVITPGRTDDPTSPNSKLADIPVVSQGGTSLLTVGTPIGSSFTAKGPSTPLSNGDALNALIKQIGATSATNQVRDGFTSAGQDFLDSLATTKQLVVQTITTTAGTSVPLAITGTQQADMATALVIDTSSLPGLTTITLNSVDFALIVGAANVTGGAGANTVFGDDERQFIVLGEDDDVIHGGGGDDTVGSLRGKDQIFGDAGDDVVYGGTNDDVLHGGAGNDRLNGGFGLDTAVQSGVLADYTVTLDGATVVLTHKTSGEIDRLLDVEVVNFASGQGLVIAHEARDVATLTALHPTSQLIELNLNRAVAGTAADDTITPELGIALNIDLGDGQDVVKLAGSRADVHIDVEAGNRAELTRLEDGAMLAFNNVEALAFGSGEVTVLAHNHNEAVIGRAYELVLGRNVDTDGYGFWVKSTQAGANLQSVLSSILESGEFTGKHAGLSNGDFTELLYQNGLNRAADAAGKAFWVGALDAGVSRAQVVESIAASTEAVSVIGSTIDVTVVS